MAPRARADVITQHLATLPPAHRATLTALRATLRELLPGADECISYNMPCFKVDGVAVAGFEGFKAHCSYFPHSGGVVGRLTRVPAWCTVASKGALQFPVDRPLPKTLVRQLVSLRLAEIAEKRRATRESAPRGR